MIRQLIARLFWAVTPWKLAVERVPDRPTIFVGAPHTSNWDFVIGLLAKWAIDLPIRWVGKESLFRGFTGATLGRLMRLWGGRPVNRHPRGRPR